VIAAALLCVLLAAAPVAQAGTEKPTVKPGVQQPEAKKPEAAKPGAEKPGAQKPGAQKPEAKPTKQAPFIAGRQFYRLTTPDGSRFHLIVDPTIAHVHWAIASWADGRDDPPGLPGLTMAAANASLSGTWKTGSSDPEAERAALMKLDEAWQQQLAKPGDAEAAAEVVRRDKEAAALGDRRIFRRVLAAAPTFQPEIIDRDPLAVFVLTTLEPAIETVAKLLVERREEQVLRGLMRAWVPSVLARVQDHASHPRQRLYAETLALLIPSSPTIARLEAPPFVAPNRNQALAAWQASQHPTTTVHVLIGSFDPQSLKATLNKVFSETKLIAPTRRQQPPRPLRGQRRSIVPGMPSGGGVIAWVLPPENDPTALELARRWLISDNGPLLRPLARKRPNLVIDCRVPWPTVTGGRSLLLLDIQDPNGKPGVIDEVLATCRKICAKPFSTGLFYRTFLEQTRDWNREADSPRAIAALLAERALVWPSTKLNQLAPGYRKGTQVYPILKAVFASHPAIVEVK
tara:strand:- start:13930 stop:15477 length:1548 start_codon:yes stop_codon:yes gene_type:complete